MTKPFRTTKDYKLLLRIVAGQVRSTINDHPYWFTKQAARRAPRSIAKRVAGEIAALLHQEQIATGGGAAGRPCAHPTREAGKTCSAPREGALDRDAPSCFLTDIHDAAAHARAELDSLVARAARYESERLEALAKDYAQHGIPTLHLMTLRGDLGCRECCGPRAVWRPTGPPPAGAWECSMCGLEYDFPPPQPDQESGP